MGRVECLGLTVLPLIPVGSIKGSSNSPPNPGEKTPNHTPYAHISSFPSSIY